MDMKLLTGMKFFVQCCTPYLLVLFLIHLPLKIYREETFNDFGNKLSRKTVVHNWYVKTLTSHNTESSCNLLIWMVFGDVYVLKHRRVIAVFDLFCFANN